jgi:hypothetical protein
MFLHGQTVSGNCLSPQLTNFLKIGFRAWRFPGWTVLFKMGDAMDCLWRVKLHLEELGAQIAELKVRLHNCADRASSALDEASRMSETWNEPMKVMKTQGGSRRKAAAVEKVIDRIELTFVESSRKRQNTALMR